jgi:RHS repeat-associated protein
MLTETYPAVPGHTQRRTINYSFDGAGRLSSLTTAATTYAPNGDASVTGILYTPHGALDKETLGNNLVHDVNYNGRLQPYQIRLGTAASPTSVLNLAYNYGTTANNGNLLDVTEKIGTWTRKQTYTYDALNRLDTTAETNGSTTTYWTEDEEYDHFGNRWEVITGTTPPTFNNKNQIVGHGYDAAGNVTNDTVYDYTYDAENRINTVEGVANTFVYDGEGKRVKKYFPLEEQVRFVYGISGQVILEFDTVSGSLKKEYVYGPGSLLATIDPAGGTLYTTSDHLGSPRVVTNSGGGTVSRHDFRPFGEELGDGDGGRTTTLKFGLVDGLRKKFTGKERDDETGLDYFLARYYSPAQGRFTSPDEFTGGPDELYYFAEDAAENPTFYADLRNPQSLNKYQYAYNNPLRYIDPDGHDADEPEQQEGKPPVVAPAPPLPGLPPLPLPVTPIRPMPNPFAEIDRGLDKLVQPAIDSDLGRVIRQLFGRDPVPVIGPNDFPPVDVPPLLPDTAPPPRTGTQPLAPPLPVQAHKRKKQSTGKGRTKPKHEKGDARKNRDKDGEKGDARRERMPWHRKRPDMWKGPWPPKPKPNSPE